MSFPYRSEDDWNEWYYREATPDEKEIFDFIWRNRFLFDDLSLQEDSLMFSIFENNNGPGLQSFFNNLIVKVQQFNDPNLLASYNSKAHIIKVSPQALTKEYCFLHEMIHMFDKTYDEISGLRDAVRWRLYYSLQDKIHGLDQAILEFTKIRSLMGINRCPENPAFFLQKHDTLFLLKSFDLDIKMDYPLGTVLGYSYDKKFEYLEKY